MVSFIEIIQIVYKLQSKCRFYGVLVAFINFHYKFR